jgi:D-arabinose 1-dehydrogenase-like Zn-dependent alcohol dehydrogenase
MINAVGAAARHSFSRLERFEFQREDATATSWLATCGRPMAPKEKATGARNMYGKDSTVGGHRDVLLVREYRVQKIPAVRHPEVAARILCAGVAAGSPMQHGGVKPRLGG